MSMYEPLEPVNVTLFEKKRSLQIKELKMLSPWIIQVDLKSNSKCPKIQKRRQPQKAGHMKVEAEVEFIQPQAKGHPELPEAGKGKEGFSSKAFRSTAALLTS